VYNNLMPPNAGSDHVVHTTRSMKPGEASSESPFWGGMGQKGTLGAFLESEDPI
jgi:hypothetical protein